MTVDLKQTGGVSGKELEQVLKERMPPIARKIILIDFDDTIAPFGFMFSYPEPFPGVAKFTQAMKKKGYSIGVFTSRLSPKWIESANQNEQEQRDYIENYCKGNNIVIDFITAEKIPCVKYYDDKAERFLGDWDKVLDPEDVFSQADYAWAAGFFDGEGTIGIYAYRREGSKNSGAGQFGSLSVQVNQIDKRPLEKLQEMFGGSIGLSKQPNRRPLWTWKINSRASKPFLEKVLPYLQVKKEEAEIALQFISTLRDGKLNNFQNPLTSDEKEMRLGLINKLKKLKWEDKSYRSNYVTE